MEEKLQGRQTGVLVARPSETPRALMVAGPLVEEMERGEEDEL